MNQSYIKYNNSIFWKFQYSKRNFQTNHDIGKEIHAYKDIIQEIKQERNLSLNLCMKKTLDLYSIYAKKSEFRKKYTLSKKETDIVDKIFNVSKKYGFYAWEMINDDSIETFLTNFILNKSDEDVLFHHIDTSIAKDDSETINGIKIIFSDNVNYDACNSQYGNNVKILINPLDTNLTINTLKNDLKKIYSGKSQDLQLTYSKDSNILFIVDDIKRNKLSNIIKIIETQIYQYKNWFGNILEPILDTNLLKDLLKNTEEEISNNNNDIETLNILKKELKYALQRARKQENLFKILSQTKFEQRTHVSRGIGLYLWDHMHLYKTNKASAIRAMYDKNFTLPPEYDISRNDSQNIERVLRREIDLAGKCIAQCAVLNLS